MSISTSEILIRHNLIPLPLSGENPANLAITVTILNNIAYYGYALSETAYSRLIETSSDSIITWWKEIEQILKKLTGDDKNIAEFVVYKNFPQEVLKMSEAEYWHKQILMYWGFPNEYFSEEVKQRPAMEEKLNYRVLHPAKDNSLLEIFHEILYLPNRWVEKQWQEIAFLLNEFIDFVDTNKIVFKENLIQVLVYCFEKKQPIKINSATDVLRLAVALSEGDITLKTNTKFRTFKRWERRFLLALLEETSNLEEDIFRDKNRWKKLMYALHPGDYTKDFPKVVNAYDILYRNLPRKTFNSQLEDFLAKTDTQALELLKTRPGEFTRRLHSCIDLFGIEAVEAFEEIPSKLTMIQLLKLQSYFETFNYRLYRTIAPKSNWTKMQILFANRPNLDLEIQEILLNILKEEIKARVSQLAPIVKLDSEVQKIKLQTNDSELTNYGRGTIFPIPDNIRFVRTASYWRSGSTPYNIWYDNGWNFFDSSWIPLGTCCWNFERFWDGAIFSGDPTNCKDSEGNASQLIDLYLDDLRKNKVRYAFWNILCYSHLSFDSAEEVYALLQWGENPTTGSLLEPSRSQFAFPLTGNNLTKYIAAMDLQKNYLIYLDANLYGKVSSANCNLELLAKNMPAFMEYLDTLPSVFDLFKHQEIGEEGLVIAYSDKDLELKDEEAYVFRPENKDNQFTPFSLTKVLNLPSPQKAKISV